MAPNNMQILVGREKPNKEVHAKMVHYSYREKKLYKLEVPKNV